MYIVQLYKKLTELPVDFILFTMRYRHFRRSSLGLNKLVQFVFEFQPSSRIVSIVHVHQPRKYFKSFLWLELGPSRQAEGTIIPYYQISLVKVQNYSHCLFSSKVKIGDGEPCLLSSWILEQALMLQEIQRFRPELTLCLVNSIKTNEFIGI